MLKNIGRHSLVAGVNGHKKVVANMPMSPGGISGGGGGSMTSMGFGSNFRFGLLEGIIDATDDRSLRPTFRDIYQHDSIAGAAVDMLSNLPFDEFSLTQLPSAEMAQTYMSALDRLKLNSLMPKISVDYHVMGQFIGILNFDMATKTYNSLVPQSSEVCEITPVPVHGEDPVVKVQFSAAQSKVLKERPELRSRMSAQLYDSIVGGKSVIIAAENLMYIPRSMLSTDSVGTSYFRRILPFYFYEKALLRGTIALAHRRQRSILHVQAGEEDWIPSDGELQSLTQLFTMADVDPIGAVIATRNNIQVGEIRNGGDFWKWDELYETLNSAKMRALGINEAILTGDATLNCVTGDTLITTSNGLMRIDEMVEGGSGIKHNTPIKTSHKVMSRYKAESTAKWVYNGVRETLKINTKQGFSIKGTKKHPTLVFDPSTGKTDWVNIKNIKPGDLLCVSTKPYTRKSRLSLNLKPLDTNTYDSRVVHQLRKVRTPKYMDTSLAYMLGLFVSEGCFEYANNKVSRIRINNTNKTIIDKLAASIENVFGITPTLHAYQHLTTSKVIMGAVANINHAVDYRLMVGSQEVCDYLIQMGCSTELAPNKVIPWSILQADSDSQLAFIAGYLDGDGCITTNRLTVCSASANILSQMQSMLTSHGIVSNLLGSDKRHLTVPSTFSNMLWDKITAVITPVKKFDKLGGDKSSNTWGYPIQYWLDIIEQAKVHTNKYGTTFVDNKGKTFIANMYSGDESTMKCFADNKKLLIEQYRQGHYDKFIKLLNRINPDEAKNLKTLLDCAYYLAEVTEVTDSGKERVYDLNMKPGVEPAFVANGMVIHNTMEMSLSVFMEQLRAFRSEITRKVFYEKLLPQIAVIHDFRADERHRVTSGDAPAPKHSIFATTQDANSMWSVKSNNTHYVKAGSVGVDVNLEDYHIPTVHWHKQLKPEADRDYMDLLNALTEAGVPVPLRMLAAAGGLNIDEIKTSLSDDLAVRKDMASYKAKVDAIGADAESDESGSGGTDDVSNDDFDNITAAGVKPIGVGRRVFEADLNRPVRIDHNGKMKAVSKNEARTINEKANKTINEAMKRIAGGK